MKTEARHPAANASVSRRSECSRPTPSGCRAAIQLRSIVPERPLPVVRVQVLFLRPSSLASCVRTSQYLRAIGRPERGVSIWLERWQLHAGRQPVRDPVCQPAGNLPACWRQVAARLASRHRNVSAFNGIRRLPRWPAKCLVNGMGRNGLSRIGMPGLVVVLSIAAVARAASTDLEQAEEAVPAHGLQSGPRHSAVCLPKERGCLRVDRQGLLHGWPVQELHRLFGKGRG